MDIALVAHILAKIQHFHFLSGGTGESQTLRIMLKNGQEISEQEKGLLEQFILSLLSPDHAEVSSRIVSGNTIVVSLSGFGEEDLEKIKTNLREASTN